MSAQGYAPLAPPIGFYTAETYDELGNSGGIVGIMPYGLAIADVVGPGPYFQPDGLPDVAVACWGTTASWQCDPNYECYGRVVIFMNTGDWAPDGQNNGLEFFADIDIPSWRNPTEHNRRQPYDLRWVDMNRDVPGYDLDLVLTTGRHEGAGGVTPDAGVWVIRNNCADTEAGRFELLFDEFATWHYPLNFTGNMFPGLAVDDVNGGTFPDVVVSGADETPGPTYGRPAVHVFENIGGLQLDDPATTWTAGTSTAIPITFGSGIVAQRTQQDPLVPPAPQVAVLPGADVYMSLLSDSSDTAHIMHPTAGCPATMDFDVQRISAATLSPGYGLLLHEFQPCNLALVSTGLDSVFDAAARVVYLDPDGDLYTGSPPPPIPAPANYKLLYPSNPPTTPWGVAAGKFDTDKFWDFVVAFGNGGPSGHGGIAVFRNNPLDAEHGTFVLAAWFDTEPGAGSGVGCSFVAVADMDGDHSDDVIVSNTLTSKVAVLINKN